MINKYKFLLLDADMTILDFKKCEKHALKEVLARREIRNDDETVEIYSRINDSCWKRLERGEIRKDFLKHERFRLFFEAIGADDDPYETAEQYAKGLETEFFVLPGAIETLNILRKEYELYIVTNGIASCQHARLAGSGVKELVKDIFISGEIGYEKPSREFFEAACARIPGFDASKALVVGDSLTSDIRGARNFGLDSCWLSFGKAKPLDETVTYVINDITGLPELLKEITVR